MRTITWPRQLRDATTYLFTGHKNEVAPVPVSTAPLHEVLEYTATRTRGNRSRLENFGRKVHSQSDEDGIIAEIFRRVGVTNRRFVEIGVEVGMECNTLLLLEKGWSGVWIEGYPEYARAISWNQRSRLASRQLALANTYITADTINDTLTRSGMSGEIDLFSLDIDGNDYHVLNALDAVKPRVLVLEHNHSRPPPIRFVMPRNDDHRWQAGSDYYGASLASMTELANAKGYELVGCGLYAPNGFYVRRDLVEGNFDGPFTPENFWNPYSYQNIVSYPRAS